MAEVKDYFTGAVTLDRQEFENSFASSIHLHDDTACGRATLLQCIDTTHWPSPMPESLTAARTAQGRVTVCPGYRSHYLTASIPYIMSHTVIHSHIH